jgi:hypothetical protein
VNELSDRIISHYERHARDWDAERRNAGWNDKPWHDLRIPIQSGQGFRFDVGRRSDLMSATIPK